MANIFIFWEIRVLLDWSIVNDTKILKNRIMVAFSQCLKIIKNDSHSFIFQGQEIVKSNEY